MFKPLSIESLQRCLVACVLMLLSACAPPHKAAVEERAVLTVRQQSESIGGQLVRIVQSGDTLHGVAFESNLDVNQLAAWNGIVDTRRLLVGQRIRLTKPIGFVAKPTVKPKPSIVAQSSVAKSPEQKPSKSVVSDAGEAASKANTSSKKQTQPVSRSPRQAIPRTNTAKPIRSKSTAGVDWSWPFNGKIIRRFSPSSTQQGVDILGESGQAVMTSAPGEVVYVGNSLKGYGNLIIIKHNDNFLSAYAHNRKILVTEGQKITSNQIIGSVGINNRRESALHFQIRRRGKPVDPLSYLLVNVK